MESTSFIVNLGKKKATFSFLSSAQLHEKGSLLFCNYNKDKQGKIVYSLCQSTNKHFL